jgi:hypothetical protein
MDAQIVKVGFQGDEIEAVREGERDVWVSIRRICESLGIDNKAQHRRLGSKPWARVALKATHDATGREQDILCLHLDSLPMWLATIETARVGEEARRAKPDRAQLRLIPLAPPKRRGA